MLLLIIYVIITCIIAVVLVKLIDKFLPRQARPIISVVFVAVSLLLAYMIYASVMKPIKFKEAKNKRYEVAVNKLLDIKKAQAAYKEVRGTYATSFEELEKFIESGKFAIVTRTDKAVPDEGKNRAFGLESGVGGYFKDIVIIDTLGYTSVRDSLFKDSDRYKEFSSVKVGGVNVPVTLESNYVIRQESRLPVYRVTIDKNELLADLDQDLVNQENKVQDINEINGDKIILGSLEEVVVTGNWPKRYGSNE